MKMNDQQLASIIESSLDSVAVNLEAGVAWQKYPAELAEYLCAHFDDYSPEQRRFLYAKATELCDDALVRLLAHRLSSEDDAASIKIIEIVLKGKLTSERLVSFLPEDAECKSPLAREIVSKLRSRFLYNRA